ncbi:MAG: helix-turn-helix domain-containing protein [Enterocloster aldenensis]
MTRGSEIQRIRKEKAYTQAELAKRAGLSEISIRKYENGDRKPKIETLQRIATALGVGLDAFLTDSELSLFESMENLYLKSDSEIQELESLDERTPQENYLMMKFRELNEKGQKKASDYIDDLTQIPEYKK